MVEDFNIRGRIDLLLVELLRLLLVADRKCKDTRRLYWEARELVQASRFKLDPLPVLLVKGERAASVATRLRMTRTNLHTKVSRWNSKHPDKGRIVALWRDEDGVIYPAGIFPDAHKHPHGNLGKRHKRKPTRARRKNRRRK